MAQQSSGDQRQSERQCWMGILARAEGQELEALLATLDPLPTYEIIKAPETGTVMVEGRAGGAGRRFNVGEATVSRAVVRLADGTLGFSYALGHDRRKALLSALIDGLLQIEAGSSGPLGRGVLDLAVAQSAKREANSRKAAATKVEFFTLVRGD